MTSRLALLGLLSMLVSRPSRTATAQANPFTDALVPRLRAAAEMVPGPRPRVIRVFRFGHQKLLQSYLLEGGTSDSIPAVYSVFQIRFPDGWVVVDAGMDPEVAGDTTAAYRRDEGKIAEALRGARSIVVTHEHHDHVAGVIRSPDLAIIAPKTILNRAQVKTLQERPNVPAIKLDSVSASRYTVVDFDRLFPLAAGVVLVRAPGHTPGSQMVYVRLDSGREVLLIGDIAWHMLGVEQRRQKPESGSREMGEDRAALQAELDWLHGLTARTGIQVVNGHDDEWLGRLIAAGVLVEGLELHR
jgi:glyoxylase-like metal-dependent hydrolase (beta-lactamase superfamily II)